MVCAIISDITNITDLIVYPTICYHFFYAIIFIALFIIISSVLYFKERDLYTKPDMLSCFGVSSIAILFLSTIGTFIENHDGIPMVSSDILIYMLALSVPIIALWMFKSR